MNVEWGTDAMFGVDNWILKSETPRVMDPDKGGKEGGQIP